jgi:phosphotransferase system  glucose/maltose/N-acetylglucosamine-specific IIC component
MTGDKLKDGVAFVGETAVAAGLALYLAAKRRRKKEKKQKQK